MLGTCEPVSFWAAAVALGNSVLSCACDKIEQIWGNVLTNETKHKEKKYTRAFVPVSCFRAFCAVYFSWVSWQWHAVLHTVPMSCKLHRFHLFRNEHAGCCLWHTVAWHRFHGGGLAVGSAVPAASPRQAGPCTGRDWCQLPPRQRTTHCWGAQQASIPGSHGFGGGWMFLLLLFFVCFLFSMLQSIGEWGLLSG